MGLGHSQLVHRRVEHIRPLSILDEAKTCLTLRRRIRRPVGHVLDEAADVAIGNKAGNSLRQIVQKSDRISNKIRRSED
jgi:hypothetical protein